MGVESEYIPSEEQSRRLQTLLAITDESEKRGIVTWVFGGYGLDVLFGQLTRDHRDIDLYISKENIDELLEIISGLGYQPTGEVVGLLGKRVYKNPNFTPDFSIELATVEEGLQLAQIKDLSAFMPTEQLGRLEGHRIWTPSLAGFKKLIELNDMFAQKDGSSEYIHRAWQKWILSELDKKFTNWA